MDSRASRSSREGAIRELPTARTQSHREAEVSTAGSQRIALTPRPELPRSGWQHFVLPTTRRAQGYSRAVFPRVTARVPRCHSWPCQSYRTQAQGCPRMAPPVFDADAIAREGAAVAPRTVSLGGRRLIRRALPCTAVPERIRISVKSLVSLLARVHAVPAPSHLERPFSRGRAPHEDARH